MDTTNTEGWGVPETAGSVAHYYVNGHALCGRTDSIQYATATERRPTFMERGNCHLCQTRKATRDADQAKLQSWTAV